MLPALSWLLIAALLALWSLAAWLLHAIAIWAVSSADSLPGAASGLGALTPPAWLLPWVPPEWVQPTTLLLADAGLAAGSLLEALPPLAGGLTVAAWGMWGVGAVLLLLLGIGFHVLITYWRRRSLGKGGSRSGAFPATN